MVSPRAGTTRDANIADLDWQGRVFTLVDTGGITDTPRPENEKRETAEDPLIKSAVQKRSLEYLRRADLVLFLTDARDGLLPLDKKLSAELKKIRPPKRPVILVANKADSARLRSAAADFHALSWGDPVTVSAVTGSGTGDLLDLVVAALPADRPVKDRPAAENAEAADGAIDIGVIGQPNVGKSSLINALFGSERIIVSPLPHTTREPQDVPVYYGDQRLNFIDTAGISKAGQKQAKPGARRQTLDRSSIAYSLAVLKRAAIALLVLDLSRPLTRQDAKLLEEIIRTKTSLLIIANKWDAVKERDEKSYRALIYDHLPFARWAPIQFVSARTGEKVGKIIPLVLKIAAERKKMIEPSGLNRLLGKAVKRHLPAKGKGTKHPHIYELKQDGANPPRFTVRIGSRDNLHFSYVRFIENMIREKYGFLGTPLSLYVEKNRFVHGKHEPHNT